MIERVFDGRIAHEIAPDDRAREERLKATARALVTAVRDGLVRDGLVRLHGFGTFRLRPVAARKGRHPRTGEPIDIPAGWRVMFRPAKALRERVEPDPAPSLLIGEPHASREAMLAASAAAAAQTIRRGAGRIPAEGITAPLPMESERAAAATMSERKFSVQGPVPAGPGDLEAGSRVTRSPAALTRAPAADEPSSPEAHATEPPAAPETGRRRNGYRYALVLLLAVLLAGLAWLYRPVDSPAPRVVEESASIDPAEASGDAGRGSPDIVATSGGVASEEPGAATANTQATSAQNATEGDVTAVDDMAETSSAVAPDRDVAASPDDAGAADEGETDAGESALASSGPTRDQGGTENAAPAVDQAMHMPSTSLKERDAPVSPGDTTSADDGRAGVGEAAVVSTEATTSQAGTGDDSARAYESAASAGADADPGDEVMAGLGRAAEASSTARSETRDTGTETVAPAGAGSAPAADTGAAPDVATVDGTGSAAAGTPAIDKVPADGEPYFGGRDYTVRSGDTLWDLADRHYVNPYYWPHIWQHNADIANPDRLEVRQRLWLPTLEGAPQSLTESDRRSIAEGYLRLYRFFREQGDANPQYALVGVRYFDKSVLPARLRGTAAGYPGDRLAAVFRARLEAEFPIH